MLLLEGLANSGLPFIFKGGTALMLLLNSAKRLSIDIDIIIPGNPGNLLNFLAPIIEQQGFNRLEIQHRNTESKIKKVHYKFYYTPIHKSNREDDYILLDILYEADQYKYISTIEISSRFLSTKGEAVFVNIPSIDDLLGDKLTAFAPETTGIPYFRQEHSHRIEIIKQLYDIGNLFDVATDLETIKATFIMIATAEIEYRQLAGVSPIDVLKDIYNTALCISLRGTGGKCNFPELLKGLSAISRFVFSETYHVEKAIPHAAKAAYLSRLIATNQSSFEKYSHPAQVAEAKIEAPHNTKLQKLKKSSPESFFYWWKATQLM